MRTDACTLAALTLELVPAEGDAVPTDAHLLHPGPFRANDGRPRDVPAWMLDSAIAAAVVARASQKSGDTLVDYEHQSLHAELNGQPVPAAGWFRDLEWRDGKGLYAVGIRWTDRARELIAAREYRYISAVFGYSPQTGEVLEIVSVALTNTPALDGLDALVAARKNNSNPNPKENHMADEAREIAALTKERDGLKTEVAALKTTVETLTSERDDARSKLADIEAKAAEAALAVEKVERDSLLEKVPPALKESVGNLSMAALREYVEKAEPLGLLTKQADDKPAPTVAALTKEEAALCEKLGVSHEAFLKAKE
ncbi:MAG: phage protease [Betaproteobacteria bacterium]|nr:phage protease [Betaproteobacteria bacterium]